MSSQGRQPTEEELRAYEEQLRQISVGDVLIQTAVSLVNLCGRRLGLADETEQDLPQVRDGIDAVRALMPILERSGDGEEITPLRNAVSQLQMEYAKRAGSTPGAAAEGAPAPADVPADQQGDDTEGPGPAQSSGRLWVPGS